MFNVSLLPGRGVAVGANTATRKGHERSDVENHRRPSAMPDRNVAAGSMSSFPVNAVHRLDVVASSIPVQEPVSIVTDTGHCELAVFTLAHFHSLYCMKFPFFSKPKSVYSIFFLSGRLKQAATSTPERHGCRRIRPISPGSIR